MKQPEKVIEIAIKPAALRETAKMIFEAGGKYAMWRESMGRRIADAADEIADLKEEVAKLQQEIEKREDTIRWVTRDRDELLFSVIDMATELKLPRNEASRCDPGAEMSLFWLKNEVVRRVIHQADEALENNVDTTTNDPESEV